MQYVFVSVCETDLRHPESPINKAITCQQHFTPRLDENRLFLTAALQGRNSEIEEWGTLGRLYLLPRRLLEHQYNNYINIKIIISCSAELQTPVYFFSYRKRIAPSPLPPQKRNFPSSILQHFKIAFDFLFGGVFESISSFLSLLHTSIFLYCMLVAYNNSICLDSLSLRYFECCAVISYS